MCFFCRTHSRSFARHTGNWELRGMALGLELALAFEDSLSRFDVCVCVHVFSFLPVFAGCAFEQAHACGEFLKVCFIPSTANGQSPRRMDAAPGVHRSNPSWFRVRALAAYSSAAPYDEVQARFGSAVDPESFDTSMIDSGTSRGVSGVKSPISSTAAVVQ